MKLIYIAGPFRADSAWGIEGNIRNAEEIGLDIARLGGVPVIPHTMYRFFTGALPDQFWLDATLEVLRHCDALLLCPRWEKSFGSRGEKAEAEKLGMPIFYNVLDAKKWIDAVGA